MKFDFEKLAKGVADTIQEKQEQAEKNFRREVRSKVKNYTDEELEYLLNKNLNMDQDGGRYIAVEEIERELERRGRY